jgi:hypothetical protein
MEGARGPVKVYINRKKRVETAQPQSARLLIGEKKKNLKQRKGKYDDILTNL